MALTAGNQNIVDVKFGNAQVNKVYAGSTLVWQKGDPDQALFDTYFLKAEDGLAWANTAWLGLRGTACGTAPQNAVWNNMNNLVPKGKWYTIGTEYRMIPAAGIMHGSRCSGNSSRYGLWEFGLENGKKYQVYGVAANQNQASSNYLGWYVGTLSLASPEASSTTYGDTYYNNTANALTALGLSSSYGYTLTGNNLQQLPTVTITSNPPDAAKFLAFRLAGVYTPAGTIDAAAVTMIKADASNPDAKVFIH